MFYGFSYVVYLDGNMYPYIERNALRFNKKRMKKMNKVLSRITTRRKRLFYNYNIFFAKGLRQLTLRFFYPTYLTVE